SLLMLYVIFVDDVYYLIAIFILKPRASHLLSVIMSYISVNMAQINKNETKQSPPRQRDFSLFTLHFSLFTFHSSLFTLHFSLFTKRNVTHILHSSFFI
ncbi:MAG: hypothetical protein SOU48_01220, partial [Prevotella sp.]|nr:hypothetical protein [Prevotella sp.]